MSAPDRPPFTGGALRLGADPKTLARRILDGLRIELGRAPTGDDIRGAMGTLDGARSELADEAGARDRGASK